MFAYAYDDKNGCDVIDIGGMSDDDLIAYAISRFPNLTSIEVEVSNEIEDDQDNPQTRVIWRR